MRLGRARRIQVTGLRVGPLLIARGSFVARFAAARQFPVVVDFAGLGVVARDRRASAGLATFGRGRISVEPFGAFFAMSATGVVRTVLQEALG